MKPQGLEQEVHSQGLGREAKERSENRRKTHQQGRIKVMSGTRQQTYGVINGQ